MGELLQGIANLTKQVQQTLNSYEVRKLGDKVQGYVMNFTETEQKVREATNEDPWGPTRPEMQEIASLTFQYDQFSEVMGMLWKRMLQDNKMAWRRVYKSLILLNYLFKNGSERVINAARDHSFEMRTLESYKCIDERGKDEGVNVRHRVKLIMELLNDEELLRTERRKAKSEGRDKYQGYSKEDMLMRGSKVSAKFNSFEQWNENKDKMDFDEKNAEDEFDHGISIGQREVTAFDFDTENSRSHANGSPELGIRERTPELIEKNEDDEEFGDFTSARAANSIGIKTKNFQVPVLSSLPAISVQNAKKSQLQMTNLNVIAGKDADFLVLAQSGDNQSEVKQQVSNILDDFFVTAPVMADVVDSSSANPISAKCQSTQGIFDLFSLQSQPVAKTPNSFNQIEYGGYTSNDLLKNPSSSNVNNNNIGNNSSKLPKTWEDFKGRVNIDFDNLSLKTTLKVNPSLNDLKIEMTTKGSTSDKNF